MGGLGEVLLFYFSQVCWSPVVSTLYFFLNFLFKTFSKKKSTSLVFLNWMTQFTFDIYLSQILRKCMHIPQILKHFSLLFLFLLKYIYSIYTMFCC